jgi:hypothetical protein
MKTFEKGKRITSLDEVAKQEFVYWRHKVYHSGWFMSWQTRFLLCQIQSGHIHYAKKIKKVEGTKC